MELLIANIVTALGLLGFCMAACIVYVGFLWAGYSLLDTVEQWLRDRVL